MKDKQCNIKKKRNRAKEPRFPTPRKREMLEWTLRDLLARESWLTMGQTRRLFSYGYRLLNGKAGEKFFARIRGEA